MKDRVALAVAATALFLRPTELAYDTTLEGVVFAGCAAVHEGPVCALGEEPRLVVWWAAPGDGAVEVRVDGEPVGVESNPVAGGRQLTVRPSSDARRLAVRVTSAGQERRGWSLALTREPDAPRFDEVAELRAAGDLDGARARLAPLLADPTTRAQALSQAARIALSTGDDAAAIPAFEEAITLHEGRGSLSRAVRDGIALAFTEHKLSDDLDGAEAALARIGPLVDVVAEHRSDVAYEEGLLALDRAEPARALERFEEAERWARRLGMDDARWMANQMRTPVLVQLGRVSEADRLLTELEAELEAGLGAGAGLAGSAADACVRAHMLATRAWFDFLLADGPVARGVDPRRLTRAAEAAERAVEGFTGPCRNDQIAADGLGTWALVEAARGEPDAAERLLRRARALQREPAFDLESWLIDVEGRVALARGERARAHGIYADLRTRAQDAGHLEAAWRASWWMAEAADSAEARIEALRSAEQTLDAEVRAVTVGAGRDTLASRRGRTAAALVLALHEAGALDEAMAASRRAQARSLRTLARERRIEALSGPSRAAWQAALARYRRGRAALDERLATRWEVPEEGLGAFDEELRAASQSLARELDAAYAALGPEPRATLRAPPPGALLFVAQPLEGEGWLLLAHFDGQHRAARRDAPPAEPAAQGEWAFGPFDDWVEAADRVVIVAPAALAALELHGRPWRGAPLLAQREVLYSLDLDVDLDPERTDDAPHTDGPVLLVTDPAGNLPGAREEHAALAAALGDRARSLVGEEARRGAVLSQLGAVRALHFAGHGVSDDLRGWERGIALAGGTRLTPADVLASEGAPQLVVLSGCATAATSADATEVQGLGLAPAFLLAGSATVVATSRPVSDEAAAYLASRLAHHAAQAALDRQALRQAVLESRVRFPSEWSAYRIITSDLGGLE